MAVTMLAGVILVIAVLVIIALAMVTARDRNVSLDFLACAIGAAILILIIAFFMLLVSDAPDAIPGVLKFFSYIITVVILGLLLFSAFNVWEPDKHQIIRWPLGKKHQVIRWPLVKSIQFYLLCICTLHPCVNSRAHLV